MLFKRFYALLLATQLALPVYAQESAFDGIDPLTAEEEEQSETYIHQGKAQAKYNELCDPNDKEKFEKCTNQETAFKSTSFMGKMEAYFPIVTQAYSMIIGLGGGGELKKYAKDGDKNFISTKSTPENKIANSKDIPKKERQKKSQKDYCAMLPMATETVANATQMISQGNIQSSYEESAKEGKSQQSEALHAVARAQNSRGTTSYIQMGGWAGSAACYAVMLSTGQAIADFGTIAKLSAATLLGTYYGFKASYHKNNAKNAKAIADQIPGAGDCNPFTERSCFCNEETSLTTDPANYQKFCAPREYKDRYASNPVSCVDKNNKVDNACACLKTKSCLSSTFKSIGANLGFGTNSTVDPFKILSDLEGGYNSGNVYDTAQRNLAFANKVLKDLKPDETEKINLNDEQKKIAEQIAKQGIPNYAAARIASQQPNPNANAALGLNGSDRNFDTGLMAKYAPASKASAYDSTGGRNQGGKKNNAGSNFNNPFAQFGKKPQTGGKKAAVQIEDYGSLAERAQANAEISRDTGKPIFDIITYRYKLSAWKTFEDQIKKESELLEK